MVMEPVHNANRYNRPLKPSWQNPAALQVVCPGHSIYAIANGEVKQTEHTTVPFAVKSLTGNT
jgi:hypothetical protein